MINKSILFTVALVACDPPGPQTVAIAMPLPTQTAVVRTCDDSAVRASCDDIRRACAQRGFVPGGFTEQRGIKYDCLDVLLRGGAIDGVNVSRDEVACVRSREAYAAARSGKDAANDFENQCIYEAGTLDAARKEVACEGIDKACYAAGYYFGGYDHGRGIQMNCLTPLFQGAPVPGLRVDPTMVHACFGDHLDDRDGFNVAMSRAATLAPAP